MKAGYWMRLVLLVWAVITCCMAGGAWQALAQGDTGQVPSDLVTLNVDEGQITQVLNAFSRQTGRSIVLGPEVQGKVTARLSNVQWRDALDAILKPYGYGYYMVGDTIIIGAAEKINKASSTPEGTNAQAVTSAVMQAPAAVPPPPPPKVVRVFRLKYLDAADVEPVVRNLLSPGGTIGRLVTQSQSWIEREGEGDRVKFSSGSESLGRLKRFSENAAQVKGKTFVVVDTAEVLEKIAASVAELDRMPVQIQIEAKFVEVRADLLRDLGVEWGTGAGGATTPGVTTIGTKSSGRLFAAGAQQISGTLPPVGFDPQSGVQFSGVRPFNAGLTLAFQKLTDLQFEVLLHLLEEDASYRMMSAPKVMTMDNQDAIILVGQKLPIINSISEAGVTPGTTVVRTSLDRYEEIGIKLKVLPQVCEDNHINLVVHPSVRELVGYQSANRTENADREGVQYPIIAAREAEAQVMVKSGQMVVIGGMIRERKQNTQIKVPFLGSIPLLGVLFRRDTTDTEQIELMVFLKATICNADDKLDVRESEMAAEGVSGGAVVE